MLVEQMSMTRSPLILTPYTACSKVSNASSLPLQPSADLILVPAAGLVVKEYMHFEVCGAVTVTFLV